MNTLEIEPTRSTPYVRLDAGSGRLDFSGDSYPEDASQFYQQIFSWIESFLNTKPALCKLVLDLNYLNSSSTKSIMILFDMLEEAHNDGQLIEVTWRYHEDNDVSHEIGLEFKEDYVFPITFESYSRPEGDREGSSGSRRA